MKIAFYSLRKFDELELVEKYSKEYGIDIVYTSEYPSTENLKLAKDCDAICVVTGEFKPEYVDIISSFGVKYILCRTIGYDHIPLGYAKEKGIKVSSVTYPPESVADYAIMLMLMCTRKIKRIMNRVNIGDYSLRGNKGKDTGECTVGVIGTGSIGGCLIKHLSGFGCKILAFDFKHKNQSVKDLCEYVDLKTIYEKSDIITLHAPATPETYHMLDDNAFSLMKDGVIVINTARGSLIDTPSLIKNIKSGKIGAAGLDVIENENAVYYRDFSSSSVKNTDILLLNAFPNVIITPHTAFYTETVIENMISKTFEAAHCYQNNLQNPHEIKI